MPEQMLIAHRGGASEHAGNTLSSFRHAISTGFDGIEMDVRLAADAVPILHHDALLNPACTLSEKGARVGLSAPLTIEDLTFEELRTYRLTGPRSNGAEPVPSLAEALSLIATLSPKCLDREVCNQPRTGKKRATRTKPHHKKYA